MEYYRMPDLKIPSRRSPVAYSSATLPSKEGMINSLIQKCNEIQNNVSGASDVFYHKTLKNDLDMQSQDYIFSKSPNFKREKEKLRTNIKKYVEQQYSDRLRRIKSVIKTEEITERELLSPEDVQNSEAARFLNLNKRQFGNTAELPNITYEKPYKSKRNKIKSNPVETVLSNIKSIMSPEIRKNVENLRNTYKSEVDLLAIVKEYSPKHNFVQNELSKLWPKIDQETAKKKKLLRMKIEKLVAFNREAGNLFKKPKENLRNLFSDRTKEESKKKLTNF